MPNPRHHSISRSERIVRVNVMARPASDAQVRECVLRPTFLSHQRRPPCVTSFERVAVSCDFTRVVERRLVWRKGKCAFPILRRRRRSMKWNVLFGSCVLAVSICTQGFSGGLLDRMLGVSGCSSSSCCDSGCAAPTCGAPADGCCAAGPACGAPAACCDNGCAAGPACGAPTACCDG